MAPDQGTAVEPPTSSRRVPRHGRLLATEVLSPQHGGLPAVQGTPVGKLSWMNLLFPFERTSTIATALLIGCPSRESEIQPLAPATAIRPSRCLSTSVTTSGEL